MVLFYFRKKRNNFYLVLSVCLLILFFPLIGSILTGCFGRHIGEKGAGILTSCCLIIGLSYSVLVGIEILFSSTATFLRL